MYYAITSSNTTKAFHIFEWLWLSILTYSLLKSKRKVYAKFEVTLSETRPKMFEHTSLLKSNRVLGVWIGNKSHIDDVTSVGQGCLGRERRASSIYDTTSTEQCGRWGRMTCAWTPNISSRNQSPTTLTILACDDWRRSGISSQVWLTRPASHSLSF